MKRSWLVLAALVAAGCGLENPSASPGIVLNGGIVLPDGAVVPVDGSVEAGLDVPFDRQSVDGGDADVNVVIGATTPSNWKREEVGTEAASTVAACTSRPSTRARSACTAAAVTGTANVKPGAATGLAPNNKAQ